MKSSVSQRPFHVSNPGAGCVVPEADVSIYITARRRQGSGASTDVEDRSRNGLWRADGCLANKLRACDGSLMLSRDFIKEMPDGVRRIVDHGLLHR
jgi:hypothetical protein